MKDLSDKKILVTGGAGFMGSHLVDKLIANDLHVKVLDNLSSGTKLNLKNCLNKKNFQFFNKDLNNSSSIKDILSDVNLIFHLAANPEVRTGFNNPEISFRENIENTFHLLEAIRKSTIETIVFTSSSTIYGEAEIIPTPENYGPLYPISHYGASKLACEALISSYCHSYGINGLIFRLANIVGSRNSHGVIIDFIKKLQCDNKTLQILGDGTQSKSYLHVSDCIDAFLFCLSKIEKKMRIFNLGNYDQTDVITIAQKVIEKLSINNVKILTSNDVPDGRGWIGDVKFMNLDIKKLENLGWKPKLSSSSAVDMAIAESIEEIGTKK